MKNLLHKSTAKLELVGQKTHGAAKLKRLALKRKYSEVESKARKIEILISLYESRAVVAEEKMCRVVENCQRLMSAVVDKFFETKKAQVILAARDLLKGKPLDDLVFSRLLSGQDVRDMAGIARKVLSKELMNCFGIPTVSPMIKIELQDLRNYYDLINEWQVTKHKTVVISEQAVKWSNEAWSWAVDKTVNNDLLAEGIDNLDIGELLLMALEIDPRQEKKELYNGLVKRIQGLLDNLKMQVIRELNKKAAEILYSAHDSIVGERLQEKMVILEEVLSDLVIYKTERA